MSSIPYTPEYSIDALRYFYFEEGERLWGEFGFYDAFNPSKNWYASSYLAIDQGPIVVMMQNYRTGLLWNHFMSNPEIKQGLDKIGFVEDVLVTEEIGEKQYGFKIYPSLSQLGFYIQSNVWPDRLTITTALGRVLIVDDVISAGTAVRESIALIQAAGATPHAVAIALDRQEKATENGQDVPWSAVQYVRETLGLQVCAIASLSDLLQHLSHTAHFSAHYDAVSAYRARYGVTQTT